MPAETVGAMSRLIRARYAGKCISCGGEIPAKTEAWWDADAKAMTCSLCGGAGVETESQPAAKAVTRSEPSQVPPVVGAASGAAKLIAVRYDGACAECSAPIAAGSRAWWEKSAKAMTCGLCHEGSVLPGATAEEQFGAALEPAPAMPEPEVPIESTPAPPPARSAAGGSALREYERRKTQREDRIRSRHPRLGGLILALSDEPQSTTAWAKGAVGEQKLGAGLDSLAAAGVVALHDRLIPGTKANIDHLVVTPSGVWVIDAKRYKGQVAKKDVGGWFSNDLRLYVGRRDCTKLVGAMAKQVAAVRKALGAEWEDVPVRPALCFVDAEWGFFAKPFELDGVVVSWPKAVREMLARPGPYTPEGIERIASQLEKKLKPAA